MGRIYRVGLAQIDARVGDIAGNTERIRAAIIEARAAGCAVVALPELAVTGYPPEDLVLRPQFGEAARAAVASLLPDTRGIIAVVGLVDLRDDAYNAAAVLADGVWVDTYDKRRLPNYAVFDEQRVFAAGRRLPLYHAGDLDFAVAICEDIWYPGAPVEPLALAGAELIVCINASPYRRGKLADREKMLSVRASDNTCAVAYVNMTGGQDELVFDGGSLVFDAAGTLVARAAQFSEGLLTADIDLGAVTRQRLRDPRRRADIAAGTDTVEHVTLPFAPAARSNSSPATSIAPALGPEAEVWQALVTGTRDYLRKTGFSDAVIGLSGGIDSALVAAVAADALGPEHVTGVRMPSRYSSAHSLEDAEALAQALRIRLLTIPIEPAHAAMLEMTAAHLGTGGITLAEENLQARQRGNVLMTLSNAQGWMVLATGNKSEMAVGYATLYGDMVGGYAVIKDVPKTLVYRLARWRNAQAGRDIIPARTLSKAPSAELRPDQQDSDSLPPYDILDPILEAYVEEDRPVADIVALGYDEATVRRVIEMVDRSEYKRRQAAPGVRITPRAFGKDRRMPIASAWREGRA